MIASKAGERRLIVRILRILRSAVSEGQNKRLRLRIAPASKRDCFWTPAGLHGAALWLANSAKCLKGFGGPGRVRTVDLFHAMEARSQLRHRPTGMRNYGHYSINWFLWIEIR